MIHNFKRTLGKSDIQVSAMGMGLLTIGSQSLRAGFVHPVNSLRNE